MRNWVIGIGCGIALSIPAMADVAALGSLEPENGVVQVNAPVTPETGMAVILAKLAVHAGENVEKGQLLAVAESADVLDAMVDEAKAERDYARHTADAAAARAKAACVLADVTRREAERRQRLMQQSLFSAEDTERAFADSELQQASCNAARVEATAARSNLDLVKARVERRKRASERARIHAPIAGRVLRIISWPGEYIGPEGILELGAVDSMFAIAEVYETEISRIQVGQPARIESAALDEPLTGSVSYIRPMVRKSDVMGTDPAAHKDARIVEVEIQLDDSRKVATLSNLQVEIIIETGPS